jgi:outer membrane protein OmpA-like peptidoglycan-associated protein
MTRTRTLCPAFVLALLIAAPASAQMYPGQGITVNPGAIRPTIVRLPDGRYAEVIAGPVGPYGTSTIHLHMPSSAVVTHQHHVARTKPAPDAAEASIAPMSTFPALPNDTQTASAPPPSKPIKSKSRSKQDMEAAQTPPAPVQQPKASAPPEPAANDDGGIPLTLDPTVAMPVQNVGAKKPPKQAMAAQSTKVASIAPTTSLPKSSKNSDTANLTKRGEILFAHDAVDPSDTSVNKMRALASDLNTLISAGATRVQLDAYGGAPHDKSSDARRISLKRALAVRQLLIEDGVSSDVIDVRAMGGSDNGKPDRVDIFIHA